MLDRMTHLFRLQTIVTHGSMRKAADVLGITQPPLSRSVAILEAQYGKPLLHRHARGVTPTEFGLRVIAAISRLERDWQLAEEALDAAGTGQQGRLRLRAGPLWRAILLPQAIARLQREFPGVSIELESGTFTDAQCDLQEGRTDAVFGGIHAPRSNDLRLVRQELTTVRDRIIARKDHPIFDGDAVGKTIDPMAVLDYPWVVCTTDPAYALETETDTAGKLGHQPDVRIRSQSLIATMAFLQSGDYLCILPDAAVAGLPLMGLLPVPVDLHYRTVRSGVIYREEMQSWPPMERLITHCRAVVTEGGGLSADQGLFPEPEEFAR